MNIFQKTLIVLFIGIFGIGCTSLIRDEAIPMNTHKEYYPYLQTDFSLYIKETKKWLKSNRSYITENREHEISVNMPYELKPTDDTNKAILLVHGLGDSPYSFSDISVSLRNQGFHVQSLLLPGHGSNPEHLKIPQYQDWQNIVDHYANLLKKKYETVWLGGFSTGANLATIHAIETGNIDGLILFAPGWQSRSPFLERLAPVVSLFIDGYASVENNIVRYTSSPINGAIAYSHSAQKVRSLLAEASISIPVMVAISEDDSVVDSMAIKKLFQSRFDNKNNILIWYGESEDSDTAIKQFTMKIPEKKISNGSHMSPLFAPSNIHYGEKGKHRICMNSMDSEATRRCNAGEETWFSTWGYEEEGKIHARLTWNPHYDLMEKAMKKITHP